MNRLPFLLSPVGKDYLWGGSRLNDDFNLNLLCLPLAEAWVCSTHPDGQSFVPSFGCTLTELLRNHPDWLGSHVLEITEGRPELPILIKIIDANKDLSIQVHPDDEYAMKNEGDRGKTEMWYILDSKPKSELIYGFNHDSNPEEIKRSIEEGVIESLLNRITVKKDDVFFIEAGTVHAIGAGTLIAEIQESSNVTYRLYDYNRLDKDGKKRVLHLDKALAVMNYHSSVKPRQPLRTLKYKTGCATEFLARCKYFQVERLLLNTEVYRDLVSFCTQDNSFHALLCIEGCGSISWDYSNIAGAINIFKGDCVFIPAQCVPLKMHGKAQFLDISC